MFARMNSKVTSEELDEWLQSVEVVGEDEQRRRRRRGKQQARWRGRRTSLDCPTGDGASFGIDAATLLRASEAVDGEETVCRKVSVTDGVSDMEISPPAAHRPSVDRDALFPRRDRSDSVSVASCHSEQTTASSKTVHRRNSSMTGAARDVRGFVNVVSPPTPPRQSVDAPAVPGHGRPQPSQSRLATAMERSQGTQDHKFHSRRGLRLAKRTSVTRMLLMEAIGEGTPAPPADTAEAGVPNAKRPTKPFRLPRLPNGNKRSGGDTDPRRGPKDPDRSSRRPVRKARPLDCPPPREEDEYLVRAELDRIAREQMMAELRRPATR